MSDLLARKEGSCGRISLNRPHAINALTLDMVIEMDGALRKWANDPDVDFVLVDGAGKRGLCAGGDLRALYDHALSKDLCAAATFFQTEYRLNYLIARYPKPYIALMDGIVMGGGIGISAHGTHRVVTERSVLAMPETSIGFIPDIGATFLLGKAPDEFGTYMALTGSRISGAEAILCGLADAYVPSDRLPTLTERLLQCHSRRMVDDCMVSFGIDPESGGLENQRSWIRECFAGKCVEGILRALKDSPEEEAHKAAAEIARNSPTSLKVTLLALRRGREFGELALCLRQEYLLALACVEHGDFIEGVRAAVIDKDRNPIWNPALLENVTAERVLSFFETAALPEGLPQA